MTIFPRKAGTTTWNRRPVGNWSPNFIQSVGNRPCRLKSGFGRLSYPRRTQAYLTIDDPIYYAVFPPSRQIHRLIHPLCSLCQTKKPTIPQFHNLVISTTINNYWFKYFLSLPTSTSKTIWLTFRRRYIAQQTQRHTYYNGWCLEFVLYVASM